MRYQAKAPTKQDAHEARVRYPTDAEAQKILRLQKRMTKNDDGENGTTVIGFPLHQYMEIVRLSQMANLRSNN